MSEENERLITERELQDFKDFVDEKFKTHRTQMFLAIGVAVGLIRFNVPDPITAVAVFAMCGKGLVALVLRNY